MDIQTYKKRAGTSGVQGHLYETKLLSLIHFRLTHDDSVENFSLATNRDDIGAFDDICFRANVKGFDKPLAVFLQAKHRENDKLVTFSKADLVKYFGSYLEIRRAYTPDNKDMIFGGKFDETECFFIMYTTAKDDPNYKKYEGTIADCLNELIGTGGCCTQPSYTDDDLDTLCKIVTEEQITTLAEQLAKFICDESDSVMSMNNDIMLRYHVILALKVFDVSNIQTEGHRIASFRQDFFITNEEFLKQMKNIICLEVIKKQHWEETDVQSLLLKFFKEPSDVATLSKLLIGSVLKYKKGKLDFVSKLVTDDQKRQLDKANIPQSTIYEAAELAAKDYLLSLKIKVPALFGNKNLAIRGNDKKIQKRLNYLTTKIKEILKQPNPSYIVTIDESLGDGFLQLNGGIASAVGNILVLDETSNFLKFTDTDESLGNLAKTWYETLKSEIPNFHDYRLDVKVKNFPKLSFERGEYDLSLVREFYNKLLFYTNQADQNGVEDILRGEIEDNPCNNVKNFRERSELIFLKYHHDVQDLWMSKVGSYLTKESEIYENAVTYAINESLMGVLNKMYNIKNQDYTCNENVVKRFGLHDHFIGTVIATECCVLTVAKVEQCLGNVDYVVLDLEYICKLPLKSHNNLCKELTNTIKEKIIVIVCNTFLDSSDSCKRLETVAKAVEGKLIIIITMKISVDILTQYFPQASKVLNDDRIVMTDLSVESQKKLLATSKIKFQGEDLSLEIILDDDSIKLIEDDVFNKIINHETLTVGNSVINRNYEKVKPFYMERRVSRTKQKKNDNFDEIKDKLLRSLYDLEDDVVLITAMPGMGKSTLLTHLSLNTKEFDPKVWIVRINLLEHARTLSKWQENKIVVNTLESLKFICKIALDEKCDDLNKEEDIYIELEESPNGIVSLNECSGGSSTIFQLKMFLHFYNRRKLIFVFDGFDEIFPHYEREALSLLKSVRSYPRQHKVWITSRSFNLIKSVLEQEFGRSYEIEHFTKSEQHTYFNTFWRSKLQIQNLSGEQIQNIFVFLNYIKGLLYSELFLLDALLQRNPAHTVYLNFLAFLQAESIITDIIIPFSYDIYTSYLSEFNRKYRIFVGYPNDLIAPPLHLYLLAEYVHKKIKEVDGEVWKWNVNVMSYIFYEYYYETKIKNIRFQEKNRIDIFKPDNKMTYEKERADTMAKHKKLGAYAIFYPHVEVFEEAELKEIEDIIDELRDGREKTGLIRTVAENIPLFVHMSFAEYFAVEYICDQLKNENDVEKQEMLWNFIVNVMFRECGRSIFYLFNTKIGMDEELRSVVENNKRIIFRLLYEQHWYYLALACTNYEITDNRNRGIEYLEMYQNGLHVVSMCKDLFDRNKLDENSYLNFKDLIHFYPGSDNVPHERIDEKFIVANVKGNNEVQFLKKFMKKPAKDFANGFRIEVSPRYPTTENKNN
ncbi:hypothetical protein PYW07_013364 [Mythimna separata]|uniref:NACHT domain-containing protein n=1 Tax=Mythimna separata TaxID=271217 RepID=A0AAD7Y682_MYTSE|nr:hypothetical protein PYW07_013364 [Mythimna separata]